MNDTYVYHIDGNTPQFYINEFSTDSVCTIESYRLYVKEEDNQEDALSPDNLIAEGEV